MGSVHAYISTQNKEMCVVYQYKCSSDSLKLSLYIGLYSVDILWMKTKKGTSGSGMLYVKLNGTVLEESSTGNFSSCNNRILWSNPCADADIPSDNNKHEWVSIFLPMCRYVTTVLVFSLRQALKIYSQIVENLKSRYTGCNVCSRDGNSLSWTQRKKPEITAVSGLYSTSHFCYSITRSWRIISIINLLHTCHSITRS